MQQIKSNERKRNMSYNFKLCMSQNCGPERKRKKPKKPKTKKCFMRPKKEKSL
jgi:hypothetical protein